jgi:hypothetical protein
VADIKRGFVFTHQHLLDPYWKPVVEMSEKYADAPKATMIVTRATKRTVWYGYKPITPITATRPVYRMDRAQFEATYGPQGDNQ